MTLPTLAYLLLGQSNMFGVAPHYLPDPIDPDLLMLAPGETAFHEATEPLHRWLNPNIGSGPGKPFGLAMRQLFPNVRIALLATARPSTVAGLLAGGPAYDETIACAQMAQSLGATIAGVFSHHGEANTSSVGQASAWTADYEALIEQIRDELDEPDLPAVHSQLGLYDPVRIPGVTTWDLLKASQAAVVLPHSRMIRTDEFFDLRFDGLHSSTASTLAEGYRAAAAFVELGHPLLVGAPFAGIPLPVCDVDLDRKTATITGQNIMVSVTVGTLQNAALTIGGQSIASGGVYVVQPPYPLSIQVTAERVAAGNWSAPFTVQDAVHRTPFVLEGRTP